MIIYWDTKLVKTEVGTIISLHVSLIPIWRRLVCLESFRCSLTLRCYDGASFLFLCFCSVRAHMGRRINHFLFMSDTPLVYSFFGICYVFTDIKILSLYFLSYFLVFRSIVAQVGRCDNHLLYKSRFTFASCSSGIFLLFTDI